MNIIVNFSQLKKCKQKTKNRLQKFEKKKFEKKLRLLANLGLTMIINFQKINNSTLTLKFNKIKK